MEKVDIMKALERSRDLEKTGKFLVERHVSTVTVCDKCLRASCWQGIWMCEESQFAGTVEKTTEELKKLDREHSDYWKEC